MIEIILYLFTHSNIYFLFFYFLFFFFRALLTKMEMVKRFQKFALSIDKTAQGEGMMLTRMGGWTRLAGLIREMKDSSHLLDMLSSVTGILLTHSRLLIHSRSMCRADAENFERKAMFRGLVNQDVPFSSQHEMEKENVNKGKFNIYYRRYCFVS